MAGRKPGGYAVVALFLGLSTIGRAFDLLGAPPVSGGGEALLRAAHIVLTAAGLSLVLGLVLYAPWVARAAVWWAGASIASLVVELFTRPGADVGDALIGGILVVVVARYVRDRARDLPSVHDARFQAALAARAHAP